MKKNSENNNFPEENLSEEADREYAAEGMYGESHGDGIYEEEKRRPSPMRIIWNIIKTIAVIFVFSICIFIIFRSCSYNSKSKFTDIIPNEIIISMVGADGEYLTHNPAESLSTEGYFFTYAVVYAPEAKQLQLTVRYNVSVYDYTLVENGHEYAFTLKCADKEIDPSMTESEKSGRYEYRRIVFDGVDIGDSEVSVIMKNGGTGEEYSSNVIHYPEQEFKPYKLSGKEKASLAE